MNKELEANTTLSHYRIVSKLGAGGMGEVYLAQDTKLDRKVALKILPAELAGNQDRMRRFVQEAKAAAALNHPNIAHIYEIGDAEGTNFIAMEFVDGETFRKTTHGGKTDLRALLKQLFQVAEGLTKAHAAGIVHRDLKPDNVMITRDGHAKILDFGLAKLIEGRGEGETGRRGEEDPTIALSPNHPVAASPLPPVSPGTSPGLIMGTVGYMSPEQAQGKPVDQRSDIFAFGCLLYEAATGRKPFAGDSVVDTLHKIIHEPAPAITDFNPSASPELQRIIRKCLIKEPEKRYQTIRDTANDIEALLEEMRDVSDLERSVAPVTSTTPSGATKSTEADLRGESTRSVTMQPASSAEYIVARIKQRKVSIAVVACLVLVAVVAGVMGINAYLRARNKEDAIDSIAVLPFENQNRDPNSEYLSDGLTESIINSLIRVPSLRVSPRSSVFRYKGKDTDPLKIGEELGVRAVLMGRLLQRGDDLIVSAELLDVRDNKQIWGEQYNRKLADALTVQQEISREITDRLRLRLSGEEQKLLTKRSTQNGEAYQLYLKGTYYTSKGTKEGLRKGLDYFNQALEKDPNFALAYNGLAYYYIVASEWFLSPKEAMSGTREAAKKALAIDESLAEAHTSQGVVAYWYDWDWSTAEREFKRAIELNPNDARTHAYYSWYLLSLGRTEQGVSEGKRAQELDPISPELNTYLGISLTLARRYPEAADQLRKTIDLDPTYWFSHDWLGRVLEQQGKLPEAILEFQRARQLEGAIAEIWAMQGHAYALSGHTSEAQKAIAELKSPPAGTYLPPYMVAAVYAGLNDKDQAFAWLDRAYTERSLYLTWLPVDPVWDSLRSDPRFTALSRKIGFPR